MGQSYVFFRKQPSNLPLFFSHTIVFPRRICTFAVGMKKLKEKYKRFRAWQQQPHQVMPLSEEAHDCSTCGTHFTGNYCPRCGQSAKVGRYSFKKAMLLFLDVWGLGNRGMFRSLRDLILRPGYMIRDYLQGMQMAYFPPFKMFFLLVTLSILVDSGLNLKGVNRIQESKEYFDKSMKNSEIEHNRRESEAYKAEKAKQAMTAEELAKEQKTDKAAYEFTTTILPTAQKLMDWFYKYLSFVTIIGLLLFAGPLYLFFRHCPAIPDLRFSEFFVAMVYTTNMLIIYSIVCSFLCLPLPLEGYTYFLALIPLKQLTGYSYWRTALKSLLAIIIFFATVMLLFVLIGAIGAIIYVNMN